MNNECIHTLSLSLSHSRSWKYLLLLKEIMFSAIATLKNETELRPVKYAITLLLLEVQLPYDPSSFLSIGWLVGQ